MLNISSPCRPGSKQAHMTLCFLIIASIASRHFRFDYSLLVVDLCAITVTFGPFLMAGLHEDHLFCF